jgi:hypothetical protein
MLDRLFGVSLACMLVGCFDLFVIRARSANLGCQPMRISTLKYPHENGHSPNLRNIFGLSGAD